jgi:OOP family OmpA-OmpF porin
MLRSRKIGAVLMNNTKGAVMKSNMVLAAGLVGAALAFSAPAAFAQARGAAADTGWYVGGSFGQSTTDCNVPAGFSCDDKDTAWKIFGGYQINRNFAAEAGYSQLGEVTATGGGVNAKAKATAWDLVGVGSYPLSNQFSIYGKLGFYNGEVKVSSNVAGGSGKKTTTDLTYGAGVQYNFSRNLGLRGEWQRYASAKQPATTVTVEDKSDVDVLSIGVVYKF